ncbi:hypothetical protein BDK51DRAFT_28091, partial [Blyttiomyces helicus]
MLSYRTSHHNQDEYTRPLIVKRANTEITLSVPTPLWPVAETVKGLFPTDSDEPDLTELEVTASFLEFALERTPDSAPAGWDALNDVVPLVAVVLEQLERKFLNKNSIHVATRALNPDRRRAVLRAFFLATAAVARHDLAGPQQQTSALLDACAAGRARAFAIFGGQGNVDDYFTELVRLHNVYEPIVRPFIAECAVTLAAHSSSAEAQRERATQIDVLEWLERPASRPSTESLLATHLSLPLIGLTQLLNYWVAFKILGIEPGHIRDLIA